MSPRRRIAIYGCDDTTRFEMEMTDAEAEFLKRVAHASNEASGYQCQPVLEVDPDES